MKRVTITRKVQLLIDTKDKKEFIEQLKKWDTYQYITRKCANMISSHHFFQDNLSDFFYLTDEIKLKFANVDKEEDGVLTTSKQNTTYQLLSKHFKGEIPSSIMTSVNQTITKTYSKEKSEVMKGNKSLRSYRNNIPIPVRANEFRKVNELEDKNFSFSLFKTNFKTFFGKDLSNNKVILKRAFYGLKDYKLHDSSILMEKKKNRKLKFYLLAVVSHPVEQNVVDPDKEIHCFLDITHPIILGDKRKTKIGTMDDFLVRRIYIQKKLKDLQISLKYNSGGKGRAKKLKAIERFKEKEKNYVKNRMHNYSRELINYCVKRKIGKIILSNYTEAVSENDNEDKTLIRNWSYYGLAEMITYKATMKGIVVEKPKVKEENKEGIEEFV